MRTKRVLSLCSGVGMLDAGYRLAVPHARTVCYVEREAYAIAVLAARMEEGALDSAPVWGDLTTLDGAGWRGRVDAVIGGIPCQAASSAGKRKADADDRWLWAHAARLVGEVLPDEFFFENVSGLLSGAVLDAWWRDFVLPTQEMGYRLEAGLFTAEEVGATHKRERVFVLGRRRGVGILADPERDGLQGPQHPLGREGETTLRRRPAHQGGELAGRGPSPCPGGIVGDPHEPRAAPHGQGRPPRQAAGQPGRVVEYPPGLRQSGGDAPVGQGGVSGVGPKDSGPGQGDDVGQGKRRKHSPCPEAAVGDPERAQRGEVARPGLHDGDRSGQGGEEEERPSGGTGGLVGDPRSQRGQRRGVSGVMGGPQKEEPGEALQRQRDGDAPDHHGGEARQGNDVGDTPRQLHDGRGPSGEGRLSQLADAGLLFPPGPAEREFWAGVLASLPELAPALPKREEKEGLPVPGIRRVADGPAVRLDENHRTDRLRALGNGCVPLQCAYAYATLSRQFIEGVAGADEEEAQ